MKLPIRLLPDARAEFDAAADWYEERRVGLGVDFVSRVRETFQRIVDHPQMKAVVYKSIRLAAVMQFPYVIAYRDEASEILVIAVFHSARDPAVWQSRV